MSNVHSIKSRLSQSATNSHFSIALFTERTHPLESKCVTVNSTRAKSLLQVIEFSLNLYNSVNRTASICLVCNIYWKLVRKWQRLVPKRIAKQGLSRGVNSVGGARDHACELHARSPVQARSSKDDLNHASYSVISERCSTF